MAPFKSSLARSAGKLFGVFKESDLSLRGATQPSRSTGPSAFTSSGGTKIKVGNDIIHVFTQPGSLTFAGTYTNAKVLLVGGGASGGSHERNGHYAMGGGGAGGMVALTGQTFSPGSYPITIGLGGQPNAGHGDARPGNSGNPSTALGLVAYGGGHGGGGPSQDGEPGGSGGGAGNIGSGGSGGDGDKQTGTSTAASPSPQGYGGGDGSSGGPAPIAS